MRDLTDDERAYYSQEAEVTPNKVLINCMLAVILVISACWIMTETGAFRVDRTQMRFGAAVSLTLLIIPQFFRFGDLLSRPATKYILLSITTLVMLIITTMLMFHTTLVLIIPLLASTFYKSRRVGILAFVGSLGITVLSPLVSFAGGIWDSLFLQVLLQFCGIDSFPAAEPFFSLSQSILQILLYIVLPRVLIISVIGFGTLNIIDGSVCALDDRISLMRSNAQALAMEDDTLECLATIIEGKDGSTGAHVLNTKKYMSAMLEYILSHNLYPETVNREYAEKVIRSSILHDVGKIAIPDSILDKPGKLTDEEFAVMKTHCLEGDKFISKAFADNPDREFVSIAHEVVTFHHEKIDGSGYPYGLSGEQIPFAARMMAIVDAFDAITSERVYKKARTTEEAFEILRKDSGTHFDGELAQIFIAAITGNS